MALISLPSAFGLKGIAIAGAVCLALGGVTGCTVRGWLCDAEAASLQARSARLDTKAGDQLARSSETTAGEIADADLSNKEVQREIAETRPADPRGACRLSDDDARRLRSIK